MNKEYLIYTYDKKKERDVLAGRVKDGVFIKTVDNKHYMVKYKGYGIQVDVLESLVAKGVEKIVIKTHRGTIHKSKLLDWVKQGKKNQYGHGDQVFLATADMKGF